MPFRQAVRFKVLTDLTPHNYPYSTRYKPYIVRYCRPQFLDPIFSPRIVIPLFLIPKPSPFYTSSLFCQLLPINYIHLPNALIFMPAFIPLLVHRMSSLNQHSKLLLWSFPFVNVFFWTNQVFGVETKKNNLSVLAQ